MTSNNLLSSLMQSVFDQFNSTHSTKTLIDQRGQQLVVHCIVKMFGLTQLRNELSKLWDHFKLSDWWSIIRRWCFLCTLCFLCVVYKMIIAIEYMSIGSVGGKNRWKTFIDGMQQWHQHTGSTQPTKNHWLLSNCYVLSSNDCHEI